MELVSLRTDPNKLKRVARTMKTISHQSRLMIIELLLEKGKLPVKEIYEAIGISQSNASQHLKALEDVHVLGSFREGKNIFYYIQNRNIGSLLECINACVDC
ncbi:MAG: transcriptional regulator [Bacteroidetes bacterium]|nr:MAG: transcriptional regulator [Bacteroidota bacterium]